MVLLKLAGMGCCTTFQNAGNQLSQKSAFWPLLGLYTWPGFSIVRTCLQQWYFYVCENSYFILTIIHRQEKTCPFFFFFSFHWAKHWSEILGQIMLWFCNFKICLCKLALNLVLSPQAFFHAIKIFLFFFSFSFPPLTSGENENSKEGTKSTARLQLSVLLAL